MTTETNNDYVLEFKLNDVTLTGRVSKDTVSSAMDDAGIDVLSEIATALAQEVITEVRLKEEQEQT